MPNTFYTTENEQISNLIQEFNVGSNDTTQLQVLTGDAVVGNLSVRFRRDIFYVSARQFDTLLSIRSTTKKGTA